MTQRRRTTLSSWLTRMHLALPMPFSNMILSGSFSMSSLDAFPTRDARLSCPTTDQDLFPLTLTATSSSSIVSLQTTCLRTGRFLRILCAGPDSIYQNTPHRQTCRALLAATSTGRERRRKIARRSINARLMAICTRIMATNFAIGLLLRMNGSVPRTAMVMKIESCLIGLEGCYWLLSTLRT